MKRTILRLSEVSELTGVPVETLRYWRKIGERGPASYVLGGRVVYDLESVDRWVNEQRAAAGTPAA